MLSVSAQETHSKRSLYCDTPRRAAVVQADAGLTIGALLGEQVAVDARENRASTAIPSTAVHPWTTLDSRSAEYCTRE